MNKLTEEKVDEMMSKLHPFSAVSSFLGRRRNMCSNDKLRRRGGKSCFLEKNRPSRRRHAFVRKSRRRRQNSAELVDVRERKASFRSGENFFARAAVASQQQKGRFRGGGGGGETWALSCQGNNRNFLFPSPPREAAVRSRGEKRREAQKTQAKLVVAAADAMGDRDCPPPPPPSLFLRATLIPADNSL